MSTFILCKTTGKGEQSYYLEMDNKLYFLFKQDYWFFLVARYSLGVRSTCFLKVREK